MASEAMKNVVAMIEANAQSRPSAAEFEMAYQIRVEWIESGSLSESRKRVVNATKKKQKR